MTHATLAQIRLGDAGVIDTLDMMREYIDAGIDDPNIVQFARRLAVGAGVRNQCAQSYAIRGFLSRVWRFVLDPHDRELLVTPAVALREHLEHGIITGDCDEAAIFGATLGRAVGLHAELVVLAFPSDDPSEPEQFAHVFAVLLTDAGDRISLDVTRPPGPVPAPTRALSMDV